jgi:hypothetical protein
MPNFRFTSTFTRYMSLEIDNMDTRVQAEKRLVDQAVIRTEIMFDFSAASMRLKLDRQILGMNDHGHFASSTICMVLASTSAAIGDNAGSFDSPESISTGLISPIFVLPFSVNTEVPWPPALDCRLQKPCSLQQRECPCCEALLPSHGHAEPQSHDV